MKRSPCTLMHGCTTPVHGEGEGAWAGRSVGFCTSHYSFPSLGEGSMGKLGVPPSYTMLWPTIHSKSLLSNCLWCTQHHSRVRVCGDSPYTLMNARLQGTESKPSKVRARERGGIWWWLFPRGWWSDIWIKAIQKDHSGGKRGTDISNLWKLNSSAGSLVCFVCLFYVSKM